MEALEFSVPYNGDSDLLPELFKMKNLNNNRIKEIFLSGPQEYSGSGRIMRTIDYDEFAQIVHKIHAEGIQVNLVFNSTCEGSEWYSPEVINSTMQYLDRVHNELGIKSITIANPLYIKAVRERFPDMEICASVLCDIDCMQRAAIFNDLGVDIISTDVNINRDLGLLEEIKDCTNTRLRLLVNEGCLYRCPFRKFHFNATSHVSKEINKGVKDVSFANFLGLGTGVIIKDHSQLLKSCWIRPEDLRKYGKITNFFKIVDRAQLSSFIIRATKAYMEESWDGDLLDIVSGCSKRYGMMYGAYLDNESLGKYNFFEKVTSCNRNCRHCSYCDELSAKLIKLGITTQAKLADIKRNC
jgi:collagenase-like PrtC family protease